MTKLHQLHERKLKKDKALLRIAGGTAWDTSLMVGAKAVYDKIAGPVVGTTPTKMSDYTIAAAAVALLMNTSYEFLIRHKKVHQKALLALKIAKHKLETDSGYKLRIEKIVDEKKKKKKKKMVKENKTFRRPF